MRTEGSLTDYVRLVIQEHVFRFTGLTTQSPLYPIQFLCRACDVATAQPIKKVNHSPHNTQQHRNNPRHYLALPPSIPARPLLPTAIITIVRPIPPTRTPGKRWKANHDPRPVEMMNQGLVVPAFGIGAVERGS